MVSTSENTDITATTDIRIFAKEQMKKEGKWEVILTQDKPHAGETATQAMGSFVAVLT